MSQVNKRLLAEYRQLSQRKDLSNFVALPDSKDMYEWHFLIFGLTDCPYQNGFYYGRLKFPLEYPLKPPSIKMMTPNGRF